MSSAIQRQLSQHYQHFMTLQRRQILNSNIFIFWPEYTYIPDGIYIYSGRNIHIFWMEYIHHIFHPTIPIYSGRNIRIFWPEYIYILDGIYSYRVQIVILLSDKGKTSKLKKRLNSGIARITQPPPHPPIRATLPTLSAVATIYETLT